MIRNLLAVAVLAAPLFQDKPEDTFRKLEERFARSKTVKVTFKGVMKESGEDGFVYEGTLLMRGENKVRLDLSAREKLTTETKDEKLQLICDGENLVASEPPSGDLRKNKAPAGLRTAMVRTLVRAGIPIVCDSLDPVVARGALRKEEWFPKESDIKDGGKDGVHSVLTASITWKHNGTLKLAFDATTFKLSVDMPGDKRSISETWTVEWDGEIADAEFKVPDGK